MRIFTHDVETLKSLYVLNLKKALDMEHVVVHTLTDVIGRSQDLELTNALVAHLEESRGHAARVETLLIRLVAVAEPVTAKAMQSIAVEISNVSTDVTDAAVLNIALIGLAQQIEHQEIAAYGTLRRWALLLGLEQDAGILQSIEAEEINADEVLSEIAERVNLQTAA
jgi:ferritin-like metal-binding protein YciE